MLDGQVIVRMNACHGQGPVVLVGKWQAWDEDCVWLRMSPGDVEGMEASRVCPVCGALTPWLGRPTPAHDPSGNPLFLVPRGVVTSGECSNPELVALAKAA